MNKPEYKRGMTLIELVLTAAIIGLLAALIVPAVNFATRSRENAQAARKLQTAVEAFELCAAETGVYPPDQSVPSETTVPLMEDYYFPYFKIDWWGDATELGGRWDWDVGYHGFNFSVSICSPDSSQDQMEDFDQLIDDGNLGTGRFRKVDNQYHYIIED